MKTWYREALDAAAANASSPARRDAFALGADAIDLVRDLLVEVLDGGALVDVARLEALRPRIVSRGTPGCDCDQYDEPDPASHAADCEWRAALHPGTFARSGQ